METKRELKEEAKEPEQGRERIEAETPQQEDERG